MSFKVLYSRPDAIFLSSQQKSGPVDIQIDRKSRLFEVRVVDEKSFYTTEEGQKFWRIISTVDYEQKVNKYGRFYIFKKLTSFEEFCKSLCDHQLMDADSFETLSLYVQGFKKISITLKREPAFPERLLSFLDEPDDVENLLALCVQSNSLESYQKWLNSVACEKSPKRCLAALFMRLKREGKVLPEGVQELIWNAYGNYLLQIEQKSHVKLLFDFLEVSFQFKEEEILSAIISAQFSLKLREAEVDFLFSKLKEAPLGLILREPLLLKLHPEEKLVELWTCLLKRVLEEPRTVETLKMGVVLFSHIPSNGKKSALIEFEKWLDQLFGFYFNSDFGPGLIEDIREIQRKDYPYFGIGVQHYLELCFLNKMGEHFPLKLSFDSIAEMGVFTAINCMVVSRKFIESEDYSRQLTSLLESCHKRLPENGQEILLTFLDKDHPQLYVKFIERLARYKPKNDISSYFVMSYARFHLINFMELFPSDDHEACRMGEEIALMRMPKSEFIEQLHVQATQLLIGKYFVLREVDLKPLSLYKIRLLGSFEAQLILKRKAVHELFPFITQFVNKLLNNGSFFHLVVADQSLKNLTIKAYKCDLDEKIAHLFEKHATFLLNQPKRISQYLQIMPEFIEDLINRFPQYSPKSAPWRFTFQHFQSRLQACESISQYEVAALEVVTLIRKLESIKASRLATEAAEWLYLDFFKGMLKFYEKEDSQLARKFSLISHTAFKSSLSKGFLNKHKDSKGLLWALFKLQHEIYRQLGTDVNGLQLLMEFYEIIKPFSKVIVTDRKLFLEFYRPFRSSFEATLDKKEKMEYRTALMGFILSACDHSENIGLVEDLFTEDSSLH